MKILWVPHTAWHIPQRAHLFTRGLSERHEVHVTDWVADFDRPRDFISNKYLRNFTYRRYRDDMIYVHGIPRFSPALFISLLRRLNTVIFSRYVQRIIDRERIDVVVGTFVVPPPPAQRLIFDLFDDNVGYWQQFGIEENYSSEIDSSEKQYYKVSDAVVSANIHLADIAKKRGATGSIHVIPNGADLALYDRSDRHETRRKFGLHGTVLGVIGNHDKPNELNKILRAAHYFSKGTEDFMFLVAGRGKALTSVKEEAKNLKLDNMIFTGFISPFDSPALINAMDIGLCPYQFSQGANVSSPMRLINYSAAGLPVVCTDLMSVRHLDFENVVLVKDNAQDFLNGIKQALKLPRRKPRNLNNYDLPALVSKYEDVLLG